MSRLPCLSCTDPTSWPRIIAVTGVQSIIPRVCDETLEMMSRCTSSRRSALMPKRSSLQWPRTSPLGGLHDCGHVQLVIDRYHLLCQVLVQPSRLNVL